MYATHLGAVKFLENLSERVKKNHLSLLYALLNPELVFMRRTCVFNKNLFNKRVLQASFLISPPKIAYNKRKQLKTIRHTCIQ